MEVKKNMQTFHLFKYIHSLRLKPANGIEHKIYMLIDKNSP